MGMELDYLFVCTAAVFPAHRSESRLRHDGLDHSTARAPAGGAKPEAARAEQIREFRITMLDPAAKRIELE
jgi:hypothetical protein